MAVKYQKAVAEDIDFGFESVTDLVNPGGGLMVGTQVNLTHLSRHDNIHYAKFYGCKADGATDDTVALQDAADHAAGGELYLSGSPGQVYLVSDAIWIKTNTVVRMSRHVSIKRKGDTVVNTGPEGQTIEFNNVFTVGSAKGTLYTAAAPAAWVVFDGITIDGNCANQTTYTGTIDFNEGGWGIHAKYVGNLVIRDCYIHNCFAGGILTEFSTGTVVDNVECSYNGIQSNFGGTANGFDFMSDTDALNPTLRPYIQVTNCKSHHNADEGFVVSNMSGITFINCHAWSNGNSTYSTNSVYGFEITGADVAASDWVSKLVIANCSSENNIRSGGVRGCGFGISPFNTSGWIQLHNLRSVGHTMGIVIAFQDATAVGNVQISNVIIDGFGEAANIYQKGFWLTVPSGSAVTDIQLSNIIIKNGLVGAGCTAAFEIDANGDGTISRLGMNSVYVTASPTDGMYLYGSVKDIAMNDVKILSSTGHGLLIYPVGYTIDLLQVSNSKFNSNSDGASKGSGVVLCYPADGGALTKAIFSNTQMRGNLVGLNATSDAKSVIVGDTSDIGGNSITDVSGGEYVLRTYLEGTAAPVDGEYIIKQIIWNSAPTVAGTVGSQYIIAGWKKIAAGIPGTWVEMRSLTGT